jgi:hypothetical protein
MDRLPQPPRNLSPAQQLDELVEALTQFHGENLQVSLALQPARARALAEPAFRHATEARELLGKINRGQRREAEARRIPGFVFQMKVGAAYNLVCTMPKDPPVAEHAILVGMLDHPDTDRLVRQMADDGVKHGDRVSQELVAYQTVFAEAIRRYGTSSGVEQPGAHDCLKMAIHSLAVALNLKHAAALRRMSLSATALIAHGSSEEEMNLVIAPFSRLDREEGQRLQTLLDLHQDARVPLREAEQQELADRADLLHGQIEGVLLAGCRLQGDESNPRSAMLWPALLRFADSGRLALSALEEIRNLPRLPADLAERFHDQTLEKVPTRRPEVLAEKTEAAQRMAASRDAARAAAQPAAGQRQQASSSRAKGKKAQAARRGSNRAAAPVPASTTAELPVTLELAHERLRSFPKPIGPAEDAPLDLVAIGERLRRDTALLRALDRPDTDPLMVGRQMRQAVANWFGSPARWSACREQVAKDSSAPEGEQAALLNEIDQRIAQLEKLHARIETHELDRIKNVRTPKSAHIEHLLEAKQVASVSAIRLLPSGPDPKRSTVFEARIQPSPRSDGTDPPAIYLHLHTHEPVEAGKCRSLQPKAFAASHLKSQEQHGYGRNWEELQRAMGSGIQVHRGQTSEKLLKDLLGLTPAG